MCRITGYQYESKTICCYSSGTKSLDKSLFSRFRLTISLLLSLITVARPVDDIPHCKQNTQLEGQSRNEDANSGRLQTFASIQLQMTLDDSACIEVKAPVNDTDDTPHVLHMLRFVRLELNYPITGR